MKSTVERVTCRTSQVGDRQGAWRRRHHIEREVRRSVELALAEAVELHLQEFPGIWIVRDLHVQVHGVQLLGRLETVLCDHLSTGLSASLSKVDDEAVKWFPSQAAYVAAYLRDTHGDRSDRWFYSPLRSEVESSGVASIADVIDTADDPDSVLAELSDDGDIVESIAVDVGSLATTLPERFAAWRPLVVAGVQLVERLGWLAVLPDADQLTADLAAKRVQPDWRDKQALTQSVMIVVRLLIARDQASPTPVSVSRIVSLSDFSHLDRSLLTRSLQDLADRIQPLADRVDREVRLSALVDAIVARHTSREPMPPLVVWAKVVAERPEWRGDRWARDFTICQARRSEVIEGHRQNLGVHISASGWVWTRNAGVLLLLPAFRDLRVAEVLTSAYPPPGATRLLTDVASCLAGTRLHPDDSALLAFNAVVGDHAVWASATIEGERNPEPPLDELLANMMAAHRLVPDSTARMTHQRGEMSIDGSGFPMPVHAAGAGDGSLEAMETAAASLDALLEWSDDIDLTVGLAAAVVLRAWRRWLAGLEQSTVPFLLGNIVRRPGRVRRTDSEIEVEIEPRPHDVALQLSGYLSDLEPRPQTGEPRLRYTIAGGNAR